ncbi:MAG: GPR endopeptidase [Oscillospiraceae bacterium]|nr:GPR endopeptidase [Oscillospiraceae bacterium]
MSLRTDMALEAAEICLNSGEKISDGVTRTVRGKVFTITEISISDDESGKNIGKGRGRYVTLEADKLSRFSDNYREMVYELCEELKKFIGNKRSVLVAGLGNDDITPDALGPRTAARVMATRHIKSEQVDDVFLNSLNDVSVLLTGVLGTTGIETAEMLKSVADRIKPELVIVIDALASSSFSRLGTSVQICDAGISPGSGVENRRKEISQRTLGIPVVAIGVPTIIDVHTVIESVTGDKPDENMPNMMVTPKNIDSLINHVSGLISTGLNMALQPSLDFEDAAEISNQ